jgi:hypothetical protein
MTRLLASKPNHGAPAAATLITAARALGETERGSLTLGLTTKSRQVRQLVAKLSLLVRGKKRDGILQERSVTTRRFGGNDDRSTKRRPGVSHGDCCTIV